jgi:hypothetical protein
VVRENLSYKPNRGCFIVNPIRVVAKSEIETLSDGTYDTQVVDHTLVLVPHDLTKLWALTPKAKQVLLTTHKAAAILISQDGETTWKRREQPASFLQQSQKLIIKSGDDGGEKE